MNKKPYFENLDGLRFFCFLSVFFFHCFATDYKYISDSYTYVLVKNLFENGNLGVNFFFVLSGFLITYLLILEKKETGTIAIRKFWTRRVLRIWPLFYFCVAFGFLVFPILKKTFGQVPNETATFWYYLTFTNNIDLVRNGLPDSSILVALWSVAIEEQFYFVWPLLLSLLPVRRWYIAFLLVVIGSWIFRLFYDIPMYHESHTLSCIGDMAVGSLGAWLITETSWLKQRITRLSKWEIGAIYFSFALIFFFKHQLFASFLALRVIERSIISIVILAIILEQNYAEKSFFKMSEFKSISKLGLITYGLYCLHFIGLLVATTLTREFGVNNQLWQVLVLNTGIALILSILLSKFSFRYYEKPFLKLKRQFDP